MLPFLKAKRAAAVIMMKVHPEGSQEPISEEGESSPELMSVAEDLIRAIHSKDTSAVASALEALLGSNEMEGE